MKTFHQRQIVAVIVYFCALFYSDAIAQEPADSDPTARPVVLQLDANDAVLNTATIESIVTRGGQAIIPAGSWPVRPISIGSGGSLRGQGPGVSELRLEIDAPERYDPQHVLSTAVPNDPSQFTTDVHIRDLTINGNYSHIDWQNVYNDGNAFGIFLRAAADSTVFNVEIRDCRTDGIYVSTILGHANNSKNIHLHHVTIHHCGRQGVSIVGGEKLTLDHFEVHSIGRDEKLSISPRAAIDLEPEANVQRLVRDITISDWRIRRVGQGILVSGGHSAAPAENIVIRNVTIHDLNGPQILAIRDVKNMSVSNVSAQNHRPAKGGIGVLFRNANGRVTGLTVADSENTNFPLRIDGTSNVRASQVAVTGSQRGVLQIGNDPSEKLAATTVQLSDFRFLRAGTTQSGLPLARVNSSGAVTMARGSIAATGQATYTMQLFTDVRFMECQFEPGRYGVFDGSRPGVVSGHKNRW